jgi:hypothetical protein
MLVSPAEPEAEVEVLSGVALADCFTCEELEEEFGVFFDVNVTEDDDGDIAEADNEEVACSA